MKRLREMPIEKRRKLVAIADGACLLRKVLQDDPGIVGTAEKGAVNALRAALHKRRGGPDQGDTEKRAERHARLGMCRENPGKESRKKEDREKGAEQQEHEKSALHQHVARAAPQQRGDFQHAVPDDGVGKRERIDHDRQSDESAQPERRTKAPEVRRETLRNHGQNAQQSAPKKHACFSTGVQRSLTVDRGQEEREKSQANEKIGNRNSHI